jgi:hypothetical protein
MHQWINPVAIALEQMPQPIPFFFRDDGVGWADERLYQLLDRFALYQLPLDLAVIPDTVGSALASVLREYLRFTNGSLGLHQHGYKHVNYESTGQKCEFGSSRGAPIQYRDLQQGQQRLNYYLGPRVDPIFTPPWNCCTETTVVSLLALGFDVLSRNNTAKPLLLRELTELPVSVEWKQHSGVSRIAINEFAQQLVQAINSAKPVGILLQHAIMDESDMQQLDTLLTLLSQHPHAHCQLMRDMAGLAAISKN